MSELRSDAAANRRRLIESARSVFAERGVSAEVKDLAAEAGVGVGTFYRNFPRKDDLILALLQEAEDLMDSAIAEAVQGDRSGLDRVRVILERYFEVEQRYGWLAEAAWTGQLPSEWLARANDDRKRTALNSFLRQAIDEGMLNPDVNLSMIMAMLMGPVILNSRAPLNMAPAEAAQAVVGVITGGAAFP